VLGVVEPEFSHKDFNAAISNSYYTGPYHIYKWRFQIHIFEIIPNTERTLARVAFKAIGSIGHDRGTVGAVVRIELDVVLHDLTPLVRILKS